jgi:hypothetical protein
MDVVASLIAHLQTPVVIHPRQRSFHNPPVSSQLLAGLDASPGYPLGYAPFPQSLPTSGEVVSFVSVQLVGALPRSATRPFDRFDGIHGLLQDLGVVDVCSRVGHRERDASSVDHNVALRALFALIRRIRSGLLAPPGRLRSPSPMQPSPSRSGPLLPGDPRASDAAAPTHQPRSIP